MPLPSGYYGELRGFAEVARRGSFAAASKILLVTPSALSQAVSSLERRLGLTLLQRTTRSLSLTDEGRRLFREIVPAFERLDAAVTEVRAGSDHPRGTVRLLAPRYAFWERIEPRIAPFLNAYPDVTLDVTVSDTRSDIVAEGFDVGVRLGEALDPEMVAFPLGGPFRQIAVAAPSYLAAHGSPEHPLNLRTHRCLNWRRDGDVEPYVWEFSKDGRHLAVPITGPLVVNDRRATLAGALAGAGIALCMEERAEPYLRDGRLMTLLDAWSLRFDGFYAFYYRRRFMAPAFRAFIDALKQPS